MTSERCAPSWRPARPATDWRSEGLGKFMTVATLPLGVTCRHQSTGIRKHAPRRVCISPSLGSLLLRGVPAEIDHQALAIFLRLGTFLGDDTPFRGIRALPAGAVLEWEPGRFRIAGGPVLADPEPIDREEALGRYASLFSQSEAVAGVRGTYSSSSFGSDANPTSASRWTSDARTTPTLPPRSRDSTDCVMK